VAASGRGRHRGQRRRGGCHGRETGPGRRPAIAPEDSDQDGRRTIRGPGGRAPAAGQRGGDRTDRRADEGYTGENEGGERRYVDERKEGRYLDELGRLNSELTTLQRQLAKQNTELERLDRQRNEFLGMAAHDLRTPLAAIKMFSAFLLSGQAGALSEDQRKFLSIIHSSSNFMQQLVEDLLDATQIAAGKLELHLSPTDLGTLVEGTAALHALLAEEKRIRLVLSRPGELPTLLLDAHKIEQVLNNLIGNALKYSPPQTTVEVSVRREGEEVLLAVRDEGPGIPARELERLFQPFVRMTIRNVEGEKSSGLGLAIAHGAVTAHGGRIWVESSVGEGSTFYVALPVRTKMDSRSGRQ
jgi:signal transduction histidine kinase